MPVTVFADDLITQARKFATEAHREDRRRYTEDPYIVHPQEVADLAGDHGLGDEAIAAAWLHDVLEDCGVSIKQLLRLFGERVTFLVMALSDFNSKESGNRAWRKSEYAHKIHMIQDSDAHTLKVLDLTSNAPSIRRHDPEFWKVYQQEAKFLLGYLNKADDDARRSLRMILDEEVL